MKLAGKLIFITLLLSISSLACGIYAMGAPLLLEPKFEETSAETGIELKFTDKKEIHQTFAFELDDDFNDHAVYNPSGLLRYQYNDTNACCLQKSQKHSVPRYLLYCSIKVNFC